MYSMCWIQRSHIMDVLIIFKVRCMIHLHDKKFHWPLSLSLSLQLFAPHLVNMAPVLPQTGVLVIPDGQAPIAKHVCERWDLKIIIVIIIPTQVWSITIPVLPWSHTSRTHLNYYAHVMLWNEYPLQLSAAQAVPMEDIALLLTDVPVQVDGLAVSAVLVSS